MGIGGVDLGGDRGKFREMRPQVVLVHAEQVGDTPAMASVRHAAAKPTLHGLGVDTEGLGDVDVAQAGADERAAQWFTDRACVHHGLASRDGCQTVPLDVPRRPFVAALGRTGLDVSSTVREWLISVGVQVRLRSADDRRGRSGAVSVAAG